MYAPIKGKNSYENKELLNYLDQLLYFGLKIFVVGSGSGKGIAVNNKTKKETFMKMLEVQAGLGRGAKKFRLVVQVLSFLRA